VQDVHLDGSTIIAAKTVWGALHGLETMSQLVDFNFTTGAVFCLERHFLDPCGLPGGLLYRVGSGKATMFFWLGDSLIHPSQANIRSLAFLYT